jgi:endoglucanase
LKHILSLYLFLIAGTVAAQVALPGFLKTSGIAIVNDRGEKIILRGMGLGGWMLQEGYMFRLGNLGQQYRIKGKIEEVVGSARTKQFYEQWLINHTSKADIDSLAAWGFNSIRLPMHYNLYTLAVDEEPVKGQNTWLEKGFAITDSLLSWCRVNKMYLILDLHATPGGQGNDLPISDRDPAKPSLWESEANQQKTVALWEKLAERYGNDPWIGGYDIINEPNWGFEDAKDVRGTAEKKNEPLRKLMMDITTAIRKKDKKHIIIIEGNGFGNNYRGLLPAWDDNMVLSFHKYGNFNTDSTIKGFLELRDKHNIPIWLGESGENTNTWFTEAIQMVERHGIGWAWWQGKKMGINNPLEIKIPEGYDQLRDYWSGKGAKPSEEEAWKTLQQLLENIKIKNNIYHPDVVDAMIRQVQSTATKPFKQHLITDNAVIMAVDFDMGRQRYAWFDKDSARYQYTAGVNTDGNKGRTYRNDGVDIEKNKEAPYIFSIEDGEWVQYTVEMAKSGRYNISVVTSAGKEAGSLSLSDADKTIGKEISILPTTGKQLNTTAVKNILLQKGIHRFRVLAVRGGFNLHSIEFIKQK